MARFMKTTATPEPARLRDLKSGVRDLIMLDPRIIVVEKGHNPRNYDLPENRAHLDELKASIRENGTQVPLLVRWEAETKEAILVDGECRLIANLELITEGVAIEAVPTVQVKAGDEAQRLVLALTANTGKPLSSWEIGAAFQRFIGFGWSEERVAKQLGYTLRYVKEALELSDAPLDVKYLLSEQAVTPSLAIATLRKSGSGASLVLKAAVDATRAKSKPGRNGRHAPAKRARTVKSLTLSPDEIDAINEALERAAVQKDNQCSTLAEAALAILRAKGAK